MVDAVPVLLDVPVEVGLARKSPGDVTRFEAEFDVAFHQRVRDGFLALAAASPERFIVIDAMAEMRTMVATAIEAVVRRLDGDAEASEPTSPEMRIIR